MSKQQIESWKATQAIAFDNTLQRERLTTLFDPQTFIEIGGLIAQEDTLVPLVCGYGTVGGAPVYAFSQGGAIGHAHVEKMKKIYHLALKNGAPLVGIYDSDGLDLSQGSPVLSACGQLLAFQNQLSGVVPQISVILGPCIGTNAMQACTGDYLIMAETGSFFSTPPTADIADEIGSAASVAEAGVAHITTDSESEAIEATKKLLSLLPLNNLAPLPQSDFDPDSGNSDLLEEATLLSEQLSGDLLVEALVDTQSRVELFPQFGTGVYGALATLGGSPCGFIATNGGLLSADDCVKIARLVSVWDSFGIPVVTLVHSEGMAPQGAVAARDMAKVTHIYAEATIPKIALITGSAFGASYVALASPAAAPDYTAAWPTGIVSPLPPATAVAFLEGGRISTEKSRHSLVEEYTRTTASALAAAHAGMVDEIISPAETRQTLLAILKMLASKRIQKHPKKHGNFPF